MKNTIENKKAAQIIDGIIEKAINAEIESNVEFDEDQLDAIFSLNEYCVNQVLGDPEVVRDPRKVFYMANKEMQLALIAICLSQALANPLRKGREKKEFFEENITIKLKEPNIKYIDFGKIDSEAVKDAIYWDIIEDWKIFRDREGMGISTLLDEKTNLIGLDGFKTGGNFIYEFARFQRKYTEKEKKKEERARESAQDAFRNAIVQSMAIEVAKQHLLEGKNPMELVNQLFAPDRKKKGPQKVDPQIEQNIFKLLEDKSETSEND